MKSVLSLSILLLGLSYAPASLAANQYAFVRTSQSNTGGFFSAPNVSMSSGWSSSNSCAFLVKTSWLGFKGTYSRADDWIELGRVNGAVQNPQGNATCSGGKVSNYDAYYTARGRYNSAGVLDYAEFPITNISTSGTHNYQIKKVSSADWRTYIDGITTLTYPGWSAANATTHDVGWEANNNTSSWASPNYSTAHQILVNGSWTNWGSLGKVDASTGGNTLGWFANPDGGTSQAKFTR